MDKREILRNLRQDKPGFTLQSHLMPDGTTRLLQYHTSGLNAAEALQMLQHVMADAEAMHATVFGNALRYAGMDDEYVATLSLLDIRTHAVSRLANNWIVTRTLIEHFGERVDISDEERQALQALSKLIQDAWYLDKQGKIDELIAKRLPD